METKQLGAAILEGGIRSINFFNGRLLSGEDLSQEKSANRESQRLLGQAIGEGVAYGLEVSETVGVSTASAPVVTVQPGLAINREGQPLVLPSGVNLSLLPVGGAGAGAGAGSLFAACTPPQGGVYIAGAGVYLLTMAPAAGSEGRAPVNGLGNVAAACNTRYQIDGVQFRLIQLNVSLADLVDPRLRNRLAYRCFGVTTDAITARYRNPFGPVLTSYGLLDELRTTCLQDSDVPLALLHWTNTAGLRFIDRWAVRRQPTRLTLNERLRLTASDARLATAATNERWRFLTSERRRREAEAGFLQFEEQIEEMRVTEPTLATIAAPQRFEWLPPLGMIPVQGANSPAGFDGPTFFGDRGSRDVALIDANRLRALHQTALDHEPIDLNSAEKIQLYLLWENVQAVESGAVNQLTLLFANASLPYAGVARFGYAYTELSRFAAAVR